MDQQKYARIMAKAANLQTAVQYSKKELEREKRGRQQRIMAFNEQAAEFSKTEGRSAEKNAIHDQAAQRFFRNEREAIIAKCKTWTTNDFESLKVLGEGAFGVVHLARLRNTEEYFALKQIRKTGLKRKNHRDGAKAERELLAEAGSRWFVDLLATFQDHDNIFMVMEFLQGGDLVGHLIKKGRFTMEETRFYMAELLEALDTVHRCGFVHRDVKPDNAVLDKNGHLKLLDFGLCKDAAVFAAGGLDDPEVLAALAAHAGPSESKHKMAKRANLKSIVGTPQYMAPEVYAGQGGMESDLWSLAIITYECLVGHVPFHAGSQTGIEAIKKIRDKVIRHAELVPPNLSRCVEKKLLNTVSMRFLAQMICDRRIRMTADQCRRDAFFFGIDFQNLHSMTPPIVPQVAGPGDASEFDDFAQVPLPKVSHSEDAWRKDDALNFAYFEFDRTAYKAQRPADDREVAELFQKMKI
eukprot:TRINITY_DN80002_c0_g1_i1.p1 TRINITY_DN80002_c0_g1~~TRINITY_DN80002_c0_g1_i1.p1  ORF type:complete len:468 (+),score=132.10 TRINITY_DN80002_c0_g1_i1:90-1493(+)